MGDETLAEVRARLAAALAKAGGPQSSSSAGRSAVEEALERFLAGWDELKA